tara:strand:- start:2798 stop:3703 length:906 start_codon:yes stop_codon:yes gene_type:complete
MKILIAPSTFGEFSDQPFRLLKENGFDIIQNPYGRKLTQSELFSLLEGVSGVIAGLEEYDEHILSKTKLRIISRCGSGLSNIDIQLAEKFGINVYNTPNGPTQSVAELTVGCLITLVRDIHRLNDLMHKNKWEKATGRLIKNMNILLIGYGRIGKKVASILENIGANIFVYDPFLSDNIIPENYNRVQLSEGLKVADVISLHSSGEDLILGDAEFKIMKRDVFILNVARGGLIDENALEKNLQSGKIKGAWLDTFNNEPYNGSLSVYKQVILTPHIGSYTVEGRKVMEYESVENLLKGFDN